jgi:hypothetical protein
MRFLVFKGFVEVRDWCTILYIVADVVHYDQVIVTMPLFAVGTVLPEVVIEAPPRGPPGLLIEL